MATHLRRAATAGAKAAADPDRLIAQREARHLAGGISDMSLWRWRRAGLIPDPVSIRGRNYWWRGEFLAALAAAARGDDEISGGD